MSKRRASVSAAAVWTISVRCCGLVRASNCECARHRGCCNPSRTTRLYVSAYQKFNAWRAHSGRGTKSYGAQSEWCYRNVKAHRLDSFSSEHLGLGKVASARDPFNQTPPRTFRRRAHEGAAQHAPQVLVDGRRISSPASNVFPRLGSWRFRRAWRGRVRRGAAVRGLRRTPRRARAYPARTWSSSRIATTPRRRAASL